VFSQPWYDRGRALIYSAALTRELSTFVNVRGNLLVLTRGVFVNNEIYMAFLLNSQAQVVSGKNEQSTQTQWRGAQCSCIGCICLRPVLIIITKADKGSITTVLDKEWYWEDAGWWRNVKTSNPTASTTEDVNKFVLARNQENIKETSFRLKTSDATTPPLHGLSKIHKENIPLPAIVSFKDSPTFGLVKELSSLLKTLIGKTKHHVRNSSDFASSIAH